MPFLIVLFFGFFAFAYSNYVTRRCCSVNECYAFVYGNFLDYSTEEKDQFTLINLLFGVMIVIVFLNVVIAIVSEAWDTVAKESAKLFWKYRLEKIAELKYTDKFQSSHFQLSDTRLMRYIDNMENISYTNDISWTIAPYNLVTEKDQYDRPTEYFSCDIAKEITKAKSLQNDLYWTKINVRCKGLEFTNFDQIIVILKWLGSCILYASLIVMGILTCGIFFPSNFRSGVLSTGHKGTVDTHEYIHMAEKQHKD